MTRVFAPPPISCLLQGESLCQLPPLMACSGLISDCVSGLPVITMIDQ